MSPAAATYETRAVLAAAYRGKDISGRSLLTHAVGIDAAGHEFPKTLCRKILSERTTEPMTPGAPTCPVCAARLARLRTA
jgi:hypothetical protein